MWARYKVLLFLTGLLPCLIGIDLTAQETSKKPSQRLSPEILSVIGLKDPNQTPFYRKPTTAGLPVTLLYDGPKLTGNLTLKVILTRHRETNANGSRSSQPVAESIVHLTELFSETNVFLTLPDKMDGLQIEGALRDENQNLILETKYPLPVSSKTLRVLKLTPPAPLEPPFIPIPEIMGAERITGRARLPLNATLPKGAVFHIQLLENALAGSLSIQLVAQDTQPAIAENGSIEFSLQRSLWNRQDDTDLALKAWVSDNLGRKIFVTSRPIGYNGPHIEYTIRLDSLKQGKDTKRGRFLNPELMAQTVVQGEAEFDPVNGIPGEARLKIKLKQDRGDFNRNPVLEEQTLILRGMETRIPFALTTDSTHFDPYAPAPFLSVSLTDSFGRVYYESGQIRAGENNNFVRLYPR